MTSPKHVCCCAEQANCCQVAGARWANRYCIELQQSTIFANYCDCGPCETAGATCTECNDEQLFCCRELQFDWCIRGPIFRYPPGIGNYDTNDPTCAPVQSVNQYSLCTTPWQAPNFDIFEGGFSTHYESTSQACTVCTAAGASNRVQYRCRLRVETVAGNGCTYQIEGVTYDCEDWDETYTVEARAYIMCIDAGTDGGCSESEPYTHELWIVPCGSSAAGLPAPPSMRWVADLSKAVAPHDTGVWELDQVTFSHITPDGCSGFALPITPAHAWCQNGTPCETYNDPCFDASGQNSNCLGCGGMQMSVGAFSVLNSYPCQDNPCPLT